MASSASGYREPLHPGVELTDEHLAREDLGGGRLEDRRALESLERGTRQRRLPHSVLADEQDRPARRGRQCGDDKVDDVGSPAREERRRPIERALPDASDRAEELERAPFRERDAHLVPHRAAQPIEIRLELVRLSCRHVAAEGLDVDVLARLDAGRDEVGDIGRVDALVAAEDATDRAGASVAGDRAELERVLAVGGAREGRESRSRPSRPERRPAARAQRGPSTRPSRPDGVRDRSPRRRACARSPTRRPPPRSAARARAPPGSS